MKLRLVLRFGGADGCWCFLCTLVCLLDRADFHLQILGLDIGADDRAIKKAYRALSLEYHPDKNPGNQTALDIFLKVAKAYEALTDPVAKKNWEEFGNPDGKQAMEVSIGLPTFLLEKQNQNYILVKWLLSVAACCLCSGSG